MKISIVIPNYNTGKYLNQCLESIFDQSYKDFSVNLVDAYSTDNTKEIIEKYRKYIKFHVAYVRPNGQSDAINRGMAMSTGDIVSYICADDIYAEDAFDTVNDIFESTDAQWLYGKGKIINEHGLETRGFITEVKEFLQQRYTYADLKCVCFIVQPTVFMKKEFYNHVGYFDSSLKYCMDYDYWLRAGRISKPVFINHHLANWRAHSGSLSVREYKDEAKQAFDVQKKYSSFIFRPVQLAVYQGTNFIYGLMK